MLDPSTPPFTSIIQTTATYSPFWLLESFAADLLQKRTEVGMHSYVIVRKICVILWQIQAQ